MISGPLSTRNIRVHKVRSFKTKWKSRMSSLLYTGSCFSSEISTTWNFSSISWNLKDITVWKDLITDTLFSTNPIASSFVCWSSSMQCGAATAIIICSCVHSVDQVVMTSHCRMQWFKLINHYSQWQWYNWNNNFPTSKVESSDCTWKKPSCSCCLFPSDRSS